MKKYGKFGACIGVILGVFIMLATTRTAESTAYYRTIPEIRQMGAGPIKKKIRVLGDVEKDSIQRRGSEVAFVLVADNQRLNVIYTGTEPLPDTFRDGAQAVATGKLGPDGAFHAANIQAKCASKYTAKPGEFKSNQKVPDKSQSM